VALDARTGEQLWMFSMNEGRRAQNAPRQLSGRGLAYWSDGQAERIIYVTPGYRMIALDAKTGREIPDFGDRGVVDLKTNFDQEIADLETADVGLHTAPIIVDGVIIIGAAHGSGANPHNRSNIKGYVRGYDVRTGQRLWIFHTIPRKGEFGYDTWLNGSAEFTGNTGSWAQMSADETRGLVYVPVEMPTGDYYGGSHPGANLFSDSIVALDVRTGARKWHYQLVHHDIWDYDIPSAPILIDAVKDGKTIKAIAQPTKQGFLYVLDRVTGVPVWPIPERRVEKGDVPGEWYSPTQPIPPIAYGRQGMSKDFLIDFTPQLRAEGEAVLSRFKIGPVYTPPVLSRIEGPQAMLAVSGGSNWPGGSADPENRLVFVTASHGVGQYGLIPQTGYDMPYGRGNARNVGAPLPSAIRGAPGGEVSNAEPAPTTVGTTVQGLPLLKPPYGTISAIDMTSGRIAWTIPNGETPANITNHPALKELTIPRTGRQGFVGSLATRTLLVVGEPGYGPTPDGRRGSMLRAYDKMTGAEVGAVYLPAPQSGSPMTYSLDGVQYLVVAVSGGGHPGELIALRLPASARSGG
jgi:quinoprotein glucose dehydrogenase